MSCDRELAPEKALEEITGFDTHITGTRSSSKPVLKGLARWPRIPGRGSMDTQVWCEGLRSVEQRTYDSPRACL